MEIPRYESRSQLGSGENLGSGADQNMGKANEMASKAQAGAKEAGDFLRKMQEAEDFRQLNEAVTRSKQALDVISMQADKDPDMNNQQQYFDEMGKVKSDTSDSLTPRLRMAYGVNFDRSAAEATVSVKKSYWNKKMDAFRMTSFEAIDTARNDFANSGEQKHLTEIEDQIDSMVDHGYMDKEDGHKLKKSEKRDTMEQRVISELRNGNYDIMDQIQATIAEGKLPALGVETMNALHSYATTNKIRYKKQKEDNLKDQQAIEAGNLATSLATNEDQVGAGDVYMKWYGEKFGDKAAYNLINSMKSPKSALHQTEDERFADIIEDIDDLDAVPADLHAKVALSDLGIEQKSVLRKRINKDFKGAKRLKKHIQFWDGAKNVLKGMTSGNNYLQAIKDLVIKDVEGNVSPEKLGEEARNIADAYNTSSHPESASMEKKPNGQFNRSGGTEPVSSEGTAKADRNLEIPEKRRDTISGLDVNPETEKILKVRVNGKMKYKIVPKGE